MEGSLDLIGADFLHDSVSDVRSVLMGFVVVPTDQGLLHSSFLLENFQQVLVRNAHRFESLLHSLRVHWLDLEDHLILQLCVHVTNQCCCVVDYICGDERFDFNMLRSTRSTAQRDKGCQQTQTHDCSVWCSLER